MLREVSWQVPRIRTWIWGGHFSAYDNVPAPSITSHIHTIRNYKRHTYPSVLLHTLCQIPTHPQNLFCFEVEEEFGKLLAPLGGFPWSSLHWRLRHSLQHHSIELHTHPWHSIRWFAFPAVFWNSCIFFIFAILVISKMSNPRYNDIVRHSKSLPCEISNNNNCFLEFF